MNGTRNTFSIILPVRNGGDYVKECVNSILSQSLQDFDLLVLENGSTDGTAEWLGSLNNEKIKVYPADKPLSIEENWARITTIPKNEFITLIGHDDILDCNYLATMDRLIKSHPQATLYQTHFRYIDAKGNTIRQCKPMDAIQSAPEFLASFLANHIDVMGTGFMTRAADYDQFGGIPSYPNLLFADFELWIHLTGLGYKATAFEECFAFRIHQSTTSVSGDLKYHYAFRAFILYLNKLREQEPRFMEVLKRYALIFINAYCKSLSHRLLRTPKNKRDGSLTVASFQDQCKNYADQLVPGNQFDPKKQWNIRIARQIDGNALLRQLFLIFKKIFPTPVYK